MCPLYPVHLVLMYGVLLVTVWMAGLGSVMAAASKVALLKVRLHVNDTPVDTLDVKEGQEKMVTFYLDDLPLQAAGDVLIKDDNGDHLNHIKVKPERIPLTSLEKEEPDSPLRSGFFNVSGRFLGFTRVKLVLSDGNDQELMASEPIKVKVHRDKSVLEKIFVPVVVLLVVVAYVNMGCAIDLRVIKETLRRPVAPAIGLASQYLFMPLMSYAIGYGLFSDDPSMWLGLFLTGCSPGGGGSNMWTYLLGGSLDLSITMTFVSTVGAFAALPIWVFSLARTIFQGGHFTKLPYRNIAMLVIGLVVPLSVGLFIKWKSERVALILKRLLKPISVIFIIFIMTFGVYAHLYIFAFFDWKVAVAGLLLPWLGFLFGAMVALLCRRKTEEIIAISIETGIQNTGIAIGVLKLALGDFAPLGDIAMVIPIAVATMTPIPLTVAYIYKHVQECRGRAATLKVDIPFDDNDKTHALCSSTSPLHNGSLDNCRPIQA